MQATVDRKTCIGCQLCVGIAEEVFEMKGEKAQPKKGADLTNSKNQKLAKEAEESCPVEAIKIEA